MTEATKKYVHPDGNPKLVLELDAVTYAQHYEKQGWVEKGSPEAKADSK